MHSQVKFTHRIFIVLAVQSLLLSAHAAMPKTCTDQVGQILMSNAFPKNQTDQLIGYLGDLFESRGLSEQELARFLEALERDRVANPISNEDAEMSSKKMIHREGIAQILRSSSRDSAHSGGRNEGRGFRLVRTLSI